MKCTWRRWQTVLIGVLVVLFGCNSAETTPDPTAIISLNAPSTGTPRPTSTVVSTATVTSSDNAITASTFTCRMVSSIPESECEALLGVFFATEGERWGNRYPNKGSRWLTTANPCEWHGVFCEDGHVFELDLRESQLRGTLTSDIAAFEQLDTLIMYKNEIGGPLPPELGLMSWLRSADLSNNQFTGPIPDSYGGLTSLEALNLNYNRLSGPLPSTVSALPNTGRLGWFDVSFNSQLSGTVPDPLKTIGFFGYDGTLIYEP